MFSGRLLSGVGLDVSPRQELVELAHGMTVGDFGEDVGEISLRIDVVHFGGLDQRGVDRPVFSAIVQSGLIMPGVWGVRSRSLIRSIPCLAGWGSWSLTKSTMAIVT